MLLRLFYKRIVLRNIVKKLGWRRASDMGVYIYMNLVDGRTTAMAYGIVSVQSTIRLTIAYNIIQPALNDSDLL